MFEMLSNYYIIVIILTSMIISLEKVEQQNRSQDNKKV